MGINRRDEKQDNLNKVNDYEHGDVEIPLTPDMLGWIAAPDEQREMQYKLYNADVLGLEAPAYGFERMLPYPPIVDGMSVVSAYEQTGGTCVGFSGMQACTGRHMLRDNTPKRFDAYGYYCKVRAAMGDLGTCNHNAGATLPAAGKVLMNWGAAQIIGGKIQGNDPNNGISSYVWGFNADSIRTAIANNIVPVIGISVYQAMLSPKLVGNNYWMYWQDGSWGGMLGGHAMAILGWSDTIKLTSNSKGSMWLSNSWGTSWCNGKGSWMSYEAFTRLLNAAQPAEIRLDTDKVLGPVGKLELVEPFSVAVDTSFVATAHLKVKNTGDGKLSQISLAVEDMVDGVGKNGFGFTDPFDLESGEIVDHEPIRPEPLTTGHWRFRGDYKQNGVYHVMGTVEMDVTDVPPPPPPPPIDVITADISVKVDGVTYSAKDVVLSK